MLRTQRLLSPFLLLAPWALAGSAAAAPQDETTPTAPSATTAARARTTSPLAGTQARVGASALQAIYTNVPGHAQNAVPGLPGTAFDPGTGTTHFDRVYGSRNGNWIVTALADLPTTEDELVIVNGVLVQREGQQANWLAGAFTCGLIDQRCAVNDAGEFTFATSSSEATTENDYIVHFRNNTWGFTARETDAVPGLAGTTYDDTLDSPLIVADGRVGLRADGIDGSVTTTTDQIVELGGVVLMQQGVTVPGGQGGGGTEAFEICDLGRFYASDDGAHWLVGGDLTGSTTTDDVVIVDGNVVLQEGFVIAGSTFTDPIDASGIVWANMDAAGNWFARGNNDVTEDDWVVRNGVVVATVGAPILPGSTENWDDAVFTDCYFLHVGNGLGDWVVGGVTDNPDLLRNAVLVLNGTTEIVREGDPIDIDGNGQFDDDAFVNVFGNDDVHLSDDGRLFFIATIKNGAGTATGQAFLVLDLGGIGTNYCAANTNSTGSIATMSASGSAVVSTNDLTLNAAELPQGSFAFFLVSRNQGFIAMPGGSAGNLCLSGSIGRYVGPGQIQNSGTTGAISLLIDLGALPQPLGPVAGVPGDTWNFQAWYRDNVGGTPTSNFTDGLQVSLQ